MGRPSAPLSPRLDRRTDPEAEALRRDVLRELDRLHKIVAQLQAANSGSSSSGAPTGAPYVTMAASGALTAERVLTAGTNITITDGGANSTVTIDAAGASVELIQDTVGAMVLAGAGISVAYNDGLGTETITSTITQYTDELAQDAVGAMVANSTTVALAYADATPSLTASVVAGSIDTTQLANLGVTTGKIADDAVTFAKTQNIATNRILGRDTAGSGDIEELTISAPFAIGDTVAGEFEFSEWSAGAFYANPTGGDAQPVEVTPGFGLQWSGTTLAVDPAEVAGRVIYSVDFTALANNTFANGAETIDGLGWTCAATSNATRTIFDIQNGTGLRWTAPTSAATVFTSSSQSAAHIYIDLSAFAASGWRPEEDLIVEIQYTGTFENGNDGVRFGLWGQANTPRTAATASIARMDLVDRANHGGTQTIRTLHQTTTLEGGFDINAGGTTDVVMGRFKNNGQIDAFYGTYSGGFPTTGYLPGVRQATEQGAANPMMCQNTRLAIAFICTADASPTSAVTIQRMRLRRAI